MTTQNIINDCKKMMLNDVVEDIKQITITDDNLYESTTVKLKIDNYYIKNLQEADDPDHKISLILQQHFQKFDNRLKYKGRTKIRRDVAINLKAISDLLRKDSRYPDQIDRQTVVKCIKNILGDACPRVHGWYYDSVNDLVSLSYYDFVDIRPFIRAVDNQQHHSTSSLEDTE